MMARVYANSEIVVLPQFPLFIRYMRRVGAYKFLQDENLLNPYDSILKGYIEGLISFARDFIYNIYEASIDDGEIYHLLSTIEFFKLIELAGTRVTEPLTFELKEITKKFIVYMCNSIINTSVMHLDTVVHEINQDDIILEVDLDSRS